jgi:hypothetical protein
MGAVSKVRVCECCGHPLPELEVMLDLTHMQQKLFVIIKRAGRAGIDADTIFEALYANECAPDSVNILSVMKQGMIPKLQKHGLKLTSRRGPGALWRLEAI